MSTRRALLLCATLLVVGGCSAVPANGGPGGPVSDSLAADYAASIVADYPAWRATAPEGASYVDDVLVPRALEAAGITAAVDDPLGALQAWASDAVLTVETSLVTLAVYERVEGVREYPFEEVHAVIAKLIAEARDRGSASILAPSVPESGPIP